MFSFQGDFKRQRNINLGGRQRNDTARSNAQAVLNKAHEEREKRELERRGLIAAVTIRRRWLGVQATAKWRQQMHDSLDMNAIEEPNSALDNLYDAVASFALYYNGRQQHIDRLHVVLRALFGCADDGSRYRRIIADARAGNQSIDINRWTLLALYVLGKALQIPKDGVVRVDAELVLTAVEEAVSVDIMVDSDQWSLTSRLIETRGLYAFIAKCLSMGSSSITERAIRIAAIPVGSKSLQDLAIPYFTRWILAIPGLPNKIGVAGVTALTKAHMDWRLLAEYIRDEMASIAFGESDTAVPLAAINIMGNLTAFVLPQLSRHGALTPLDTGFIAACTVCARLIPSCNLFESSSKRATVPVDLVAQLLKAVDTSALKWLNGVLSVQVLGLLVRASCMDTSARENIYARNAQELLLIFIQKWGKTASSTVIDNIFQTVDIRTVGWRAILQDPQFLHSFAGDRVQVSTIKSHNLAQLYLLCEVLNRQLETIGDDELFQQGVSLPLSDIRTIARVCRNIAFALYWSQETSDELAHIRDSAATLARQLFIRNARHPFVDEDFWLVPPTLLDMTSFADKVAEDPMFSSEAKGIDSDSDSSSAEDSDSDSSTDMSRAGIRAPNSRRDWALHTYSNIARQRQRRADQMIMTPRIAVLRNIPFVVPFNDRVRLFHALVNRDRARLGLSAIGRGSDSFAYNYTFAEATVRRGRIFDDGFQQLYPVLTGKPMTSESDRSNVAGGADSRGASSSGWRVVDDPSEMDHTGVAPGEFVEGMSDVWRGNVRQYPAMSAFDGGIENPEMVDSDGFAFRNAMSEIGGGDDVAFRNAMSEMGSSGSSQVSRQDMFKYRMKITFVDQYGMQEAGIDGGGVFKEFLTSLVREAFDPHMGLFTTTAQHNIYPNPESMQADSEARQLVLDKYKFLGAVIGKALYEGVLVDAPFALFFLGCCVGQLPEFNDLPTLDEDLYNGLVALKNYVVTQPSDEDEIYKVFGLDFTLTVSMRDGQRKTVLLVPQGDQIKVTAQNRLQYLDLIAQYKLDKQIAAPVRAFVSGLHTVIPETWMRLLFASPLELSRLLCGDSGAIDVRDWQRNTVYEGAFHALGKNHAMVREFWDVVETELTESQRQRLCRFATSCERPPLLGFAELNPRFCISGNNVDGADSRLPSASTCVNLLKLPVYSSRQIMRDKLVTAIESNAGFDLS
ncbi:ubiquitin-protein ligase (E3) [Coemansia sp. RSA 1822]|nr:ubiquitin-protein ligase (E3) [Coemansia sp. RSA 638]KAJ2544836.1 ubiquitin-protein ligase (E3) [Coemansia sp. RSA 1853]KAJ2565684.1 ubiquitin-protein ligase (E3) [Coemansia sp. RSA 1822]